MRARPSDHSDRLLQGALAALAVAALTSLGATSAQAAPKPFVYAVVVDGLDGDRVDSGQAPFISSLLAGEDGQATYFQESRSVLPAETNPNHTAMMSGAYPGQSGIAANAFALYAPLVDGNTCERTGPFDFTAPPTETSGESRTCPRAQFTFEAIKRQASGGATPTTAAIMGKPKLGRIFAGRNVRATQTDTDHLWAPCDSGADDDDYCDPDAPTNPATGYAAADSFVMDEVIRTVEEGVRARGKLRRPRLTFVNLPQVDSAGHALGVEAPAYDTAIGQADTEIERLVTTLQAEGIWERSVLIVLSDHSMDTTPQKIDLTGEFEGAGIAEGDFVAVDNGGADLIYLSDRRSGSRHRVLEEMRAVAEGTTGVQEALYRKPNPRDGGEQFTVEGAHPGWNSAGPRSGDLFVTAEDGYAFSEENPGSNPLVGNHGGSLTRDNFLAVIGGGQLVRQRTLADDAAPDFDDTEMYPRQAENVDVAPTVMRLFGLRPPKDSRGRFLRQAFRPGQLVEADR